MHRNQKHTGKTIKNRIFSTLIGCLFATVSLSGLTDQREPTILYIDETGLPFSELIDKISKETGYRIVLVGEWPDTPVSTSLKGISLEAGLEKITKELGGISHILVFDNDQKTVKIVSIEQGKNPDGELAREFSPNPEENYITPPSPYGEPGLTESQLSEIKAEHSIASLNNTPDNEISPPSEFGPGLTTAELAAIKEDYNINIKLHHNEIFLSPSSEHGDGLTYSELAQIKALHRKRLAAAGPSTMVSAPDGENPGITLVELERIKAAHHATKIKESDVVSPPSSHGPGLTVGEVQKIKNDSIIITNK